MRAATSGSYFILASISFLQIGKHLFLQRKKKQKNTLHITGLLFHFLPKMSIHILEAIFSEIMSF